MKYESQRDEVCDAYENYFWRKITKEPRFFDEVQRIVDLHKSGKDIALACWCAPKRCHAETIKRFVEEC